MREGYEIYFQIKPENGEKYWIPNSCCSTCAILLRSVYRQMSMIPSDLFPYLLERT